MKPKNSRYHLPLSSVLFNSQVSLGSPRPTTAHTLGLVNLYDAQDTTVTALPQPISLPHYTPPASPHNTSKRSVWRWVLSKIKAIFRHKQYINVGSPTGFQHLETGGAQPLRPGPYSLAVDNRPRKRRTGAAMDREDESDWEDVEETVIFTAQRKSCGEAFRD